MWTLKMEIVQSIYNLSYTVKQYNGFIIQKSNIKLIIFVRPFIRYIKLTQNTRWCLKLFSFAFIQSYSLIPPFSLSARKFSMKLLVWQIFVTTQMKKKKPAAFSPAIEMKQQSRCHVTTFTNRSVQTVAVYMVT